MKRMTLLVLALSVVLTAGCTSYSGISQADKAGTYYITTNTNSFGIHPGVQLCKTAGNNGDLKCKSVNVD